jgi:hypothetical protein
MRVVKSPSFGYSFLSPMPKVVVAKTPIFDTSYVETLSQRGKCVPQPQPSGADPYGFAPAQRHSW